MVKRAPKRPFPRGIVEIPSARVDPRADADPYVTQKISRAELDEALKRTKSGTRPVTRSRPGDGASYDEESFAGPRESSPEVTIVRIDSVELSTIDPSSLPEPSPPPSLGAPTPTPGALSIPRESHTRATTLAQRLRMTPRTAFVAGIAVAVFVVLAVLAGFFAGRISLH